MHVSDCAIFNPVEYLWKETEKKLCKLNMLKIERKTKHFLFIYFFYRNGLGLNKVIDFNEQYESFT